MKICQISVANAAAMLVVATMVLIVVVVADDVEASNSGSVDFESKRTENKKSLCPFSPTVELKARKTSLAVSKLDQRTLDISHSRNGKPPIFMMPPLPKIMDSKNVNHLQSNNPAKGLGIDRNVGSPANGFGNNGGDNDGFDSDHEYDECDDDDVDDCDEEDGYEEEREESDDDDEDDDDDDNYDGHNTDHEDRFYDEENAEWGDGDEDEDEDDYENYEGDYDHDYEDDDDDDGKSRSDWNVYNKYKDQQVQSTSLNRHLGNEQDKKEQDKEHPHRLSHEIGQHPVQFVNKANTAHHEDNPSVAGLHSAGLDSNSSDAPSSMARLPLHILVLVVGAVLLF